MLTLFYPLIQRKTLKRKQTHFESLLCIGLIASAISLGVANAQEAVLVESNLVYGSAIDYTGSNVS